MTSVAKGVNVPVGADISGLKTGLSQASREVQAFAAKQAGQAVSAQASPAAGKGLGAKSAAQQIAHLAGGPASDIANLVFNPGAGALAAGAATVGVLYRMAENTRAVRMESARLGTSVEYYQNLSLSARKAGVDIGAVASGLEKAQSMASAALTGNRADQMFFEQIGLSRGDLERGRNDTDYLGQRLSGANMSAGQKIMAFGSVSAANAIAGGGKENPYGLNTGERAGLENFRKGIGEIGDAAVKGAGMFASANAIWSEQLWDAMHGKLTGNETAANRIVHRQERQEQAEREGKLEALYRKTANEQTAALMSPQEQAELDRRTRQPLANYMSAQAQSRAETQTRSNLYEAEAPGVRPWQQLQRERELIDRNEADKMYSPAQAEQRRINLNASAIDKFSPVLSKGERLDYQMTNAGKQWKAIQSDSEAAPDESKFAARELGNQITDYVDSMTRSGPLAGAYDVNSAGGYQQQVSAEYAMQQSSDAQKMIDLLLRIAVANEQIEQSQADAVHGQLGYQYDPISGVGSR